MSDDKKIKSELIAAGHNPELVDRTADAANGLRAILNDIPTPPDDSLRDVFTDEA